MRSLFFRFFFSFLVIMVIAGSISALVFSTMSRLSVESAREELSRDFTGRIARFILVSGRPLQEPVAWQGPIVMNTPEELSRAFQEYRDGTFLKHGQPGREP